MATYDVIVIGTGGVGSAATYHLAQRGLNVLGLDRFAHGHDRGSSHGQTRIIRQAYFEHPDYVPLVKNAYTFWQALEQESRSNLFHQVGLLEVGPRDGVLIPGILDSVDKYQVRGDELTTGEIHREFPAFRAPDGYVGVFERDAGYLLVEQCVLAHLELAQRHGAVLLTDEEVIDWNSTYRQVTVRTRHQEYSAHRLIITAGAWSRILLTDLGISLRVLAKHLHWYASQGADLQQRHGCPTFFYEVPEGWFYGFPETDQRGVKIAEHSGGKEVRDPSNLDRTVDSHDRQRVERFMKSWLPQLSSRAVDHSVCMYTMTPDEHFVVDLHPGHNNVCFAAGLSGHGFKFTGVLGSALADLATEQRTDLPIEFLRCSRPSLYEKS